MDTSKYDVVFLLKDKLLGGMTVVLRLTCFGN